MAMRSVIFLAILGSLAGCEDNSPASLVGDYRAPGVYALAGDTITVWKRQRRDDGSWRFQAYSITPAGTVEYLDEADRGDGAETMEEAHDAAELRSSFTLAASEFEAIRTKAALLRPISLGPDDPVGGYGGEVAPRGCQLDPGRARLSGINFLNRGNWGAFVLQPDCNSASGAAAAAIMSDLFDRLSRGGAGAQDRPAAPGQASVAGT